MQLRITGVDSFLVRCLLSTTLDICTIINWFKLGLRGEMAITIELKPTAIDPCGKKLPVQLAKLNGTSLRNLLYLIRPQPMCLELPWKLNESAVIEEY